MTLSEALKSINHYPIPDATIKILASERGMDETQDIDAAGLNSSQYKLLQADVLMWLSRAPNISESGISYSFTKSEKDEMRNRAAFVYERYGSVEDLQGTNKIQYGHKGSNL